MLRCHNHNYFLGRIFSNALVKIVLLLSAGMAASAFLTRRCGNNGVISRAGTDADSFSRRNYKKVYRLLSTTVIPEETSNQTSSLGAITDKTYHHQQQQQQQYQPLDRHPDFPESAYEERDFFRFEILHESSKSQARVGRIHTPHGIIDTPGFVAVATNAALKGVDFRTADDDAGQQLIFANTYHLLIHPGSEIVRDAGGIHQWTGRHNRPFITDSGGFQVFSLAYGSVHEELSSKGELKRRAGKKKNEVGKHSDMVQVSEEGAIFRSYRDGSKFLLTPESTVQAQKDIGADIIIPLDELPPYHVDRNRLVDSVDRYVTCSTCGDAAWHKLSFLCHF